MTIALSNQGIESTFTPQNGIRVGISEGNVAVTVDDYQGRASGLFNLIYPINTESEKDGFFTEYTGQNRDEFTLTWQLDSSTHTVIYAGQPIATFLENKNAWRVVVRLLKIPELGALLQQDGDYLLQENGDRILIEVS